MILAVLGMIGGAILVLPFLLPMTMSVMIGSGSFVLLIASGWFYFSFLLLKRNSKDDVEGVKKMIKIGSTVIGSLQTVVSVISILYGIIFFIIYSTISLIGPILIVAGGILLIFQSLLLHGIRTKSAGKIKPWIIFMIVIFTINIIMYLVGCILTKNFLSTILLMILQTKFFLYILGMVIVHYNILLDDQNLHESAIENFSHEKHVDSERTELPPPYSHVV